MVGSDQQRVRRRRLPFDASDTALSHLPKGQGG
jgi:hypothetical protein